MWWVLRTAVRSQSVNFVHAECVLVQVAVPHLQNVLVWFPVSSEPDCFLSAGMAYHNCVSFDVQLQHLVLFAWFVVLGVLLSPQGYVGIDLWLDAVGVQTHVLRWVGE